MSVRYSKAVSQQQFHGRNHTEHVKSRVVHPSLFGIRQTDDKALEV
jgi:hypothetical protein